MNRLFLRAAFALGLVLSMSGPSFATSWQCRATLKWIGSGSVFNVPPFGMSDSAVLTAQNTQTQGCKTKLIADWMGTYPQNLGRAFKQLGLSPSQQNQICSVHSGDMVATVYSFAGTGNSSPLISFNQPVPSPPCISTFAP